MKPLLTSLLTLSIFCCGTVFSQPIHLIRKHISEAPAPVITAQSTQNGGSIVTIQTEADSADKAVIHYTVNSSDPTENSPIYHAPFLITQKQIVKAKAWVAGDAPSKVVSQLFGADIVPGSLVWSDEFTNRSGQNAQPDAKVWGYETGNSGFGNHELEHYCAWNSTPTSNADICDPTHPNAFVGTDNFLHIVARQTAQGSFTSARLVSKNLFSFRYGRVEVRAKVPEGQGYWPAFWTLGNQIATVNWPACGEQDILERVNAATDPDWNEGSIHGIGFVGDAGMGTKFYFPKGQTAAEWHTYGMIWKLGSVAYYVDDPTHPYVTYTTEDLKKYPGSLWPFDTGDSAFLILNLAVGGDWPKAPDQTTKFPGEMVVDYVRIYSN